MMRWMAWLILAGATACATDESSSGLTDWGMDGWGSSTSGSTVVAALSGARLVGSVDRFSADVDDGWGTLSTWAGEADPGFGIDVRGRDDGVVMGAVWVSGIDVADLRVGDVLHGGAAREPSPAGVWLDMVGCAGDLEDYWEADVMATDVVVEVEERTPEGVTVSYMGRLETGQNLRATVTIPRTD